ncbi:MAG: malic enzyme-like NAD(P)-binding protein [Sedimentibacter sp.]|uniref:NAD(P)-dependent malic enzyme n=1 Tax=Sedimentibacter sp. TaxID=1960295 RepID=UPI002981FA67|nr:malic enzyme-like NAD(P)-binding protein [Sedimentibacter sp.]MDW5298845.1 malic enzyme-like NAD(P)-binding protein [Sedimentibacter sp.]
MNYNEEALKMHETFKGKIEVMSKVKVENRDDLSIAYTPGVAEPCRKIHKNIEDAYKYTAKGNLVAVLTDGSAVLGLGNIGAEAAIPVMEGKAVLFKKFAGVDAFPICVKSQDIEEIIKTAINIAPVFGGINLEDIQAPKCFEIENRLKEILDIPVFHDDQHGTAIVVSAALINALKFTKKSMEDVKIVLNGPGAAGTAIIKMLLSLGARNIITCDSKGIVVEGREGGLNAHKSELAAITNKEKMKGTLKDAMVGADVFVGVSAPNSVTEEMVKSMNKDSILFAMANPTPEIMPDIAKKAGAAVVGTGRSDFPNQINNVLAFPGIFRGALDCRAKQITEEMKKAAAYAIAGLVLDDQLADDFIIPGPFNNKVADVVAKAVAEAWGNSFILQHY